MQYVHATSWDTGITALSERLRRELSKNKRVVWLLGGGSNIAASVKVMDTINDDQSEHLRVFMTDERFGAVGHEHSNSRQLLEAGFNLRQAMFMPMLAPGFSLDETQERYAQALQGAVENADVVIAQFGIGPDGHIAGILPHSPAVSAKGWIAAYEAPPYIRVTMTFNAMRSITAAYAMAFGEDKHQALHRLQTEQLSLDDQPSQILKTFPEAYLFSDQVETQQ